MSQDIATLQFKAETSDLKNANNELDKLAANAKKAEQAAEKASVATDKLNKTAEGLTQSTKRSAQASAENAASMKNSWQEMQNLVSKINPGSKALGDLEKITSQLAKTNRDYLNSSVDLNKNMLQIAGMGELSDTLQKENRKASQEATAATLEQQKALEKLLQQIDPTVKAFAELDRQVLKLAEASKAGIISDEQFKRYSAVLEDTRNDLSKVADSLTAEGRAAAEEESVTRKAAETKEKFLVKLREQTDLYKTSASSTAAYRAEQLGVSKEAAPLVAAIREQEEATARDAEQKKLAAIAARGLKEEIKKLEAEERASVKATRDQEAADKAATDAKEKFLRQLKEQVATQGLSKKELLEYRASQLGVSSAADTYIKKIKESEGAVHSFNLQSSAARKEIAIMLGELARGNFGALKGSSITLANRSGLIDQLMSFKGAAIASGFALVAGGLYAVTKAAYEGSQEMSNYGKALALTGDYAGRSKEGLAALAKQLTTGTTTTREAAEAVASVARSGKFTGDQLRDASKGILDFQKATGESAAAAASAFEKIASDPVKGLLSLNETYHFLTASVYQQIEALVKQGNTQDAVTLGVKTYADAMAERAEGVKENLGSIEQGWGSLKNAAKFAWDAMLGVGREKSLDDQLKDALARAKAKAAGVPGIALGGVDVQDSASDAARIRAQLLLGDLTAAKAEAETKSREKNLELAQKINAIDTKTLTNAEKRTKEINTVNEALNSGVIKNQEEADRLIKNINAKYKDQKTASTKTPVLKLDQGDKLTDQYAAQNLALDAQIQLLKNRSAYESNASTQRKDYLELQAKYTVLEQKATEKKLTTQEQQILAVKDEALAQAKILADKGDTLAAMQKQAQVSDELSKLQETQTLSAEVYAKHNGESTKQLERQLALAQTRAAVLAKGGTQQQATQAIAIKQFDYDAEDARSKDWIGGMKKGLKDWAEAASDYAKIAGDAVKSGMSLASDAVANFVLTGKLDFAEFTKSILKMIVQIISQLMVMNALKAGANAVGFGGLFANANGGVYNDPSLSKFSNGVYDSPQTFQFGGRSQFAKGGVFAEAGPEAIMPLTRDSNGRLGVKAEGGGGGGGVSISQNVTVNTNGQATTNTTSGSALGQALGNQMSAAAIEVVKRALQPGGLIYNANNGR